MVNLFVVILLCVSLTLNVWCSSAFAAEAFYSSKNVVSEYVNIIVDADNMVTKKLSDISANNIGNIHGPLLTEINELESRIQALSYYVKSNGIDIDVSERCDFVRIGLSVGVINIALESIRSCGDSTCVHGLEEQEIRKIEYFKSRIENALVGCRNYINEDNRFASHKIKR